MTFRLRQRLSPESPTSDTRTGSDGKPPSRQITKLLAAAHSYDDKYQAAVVRAGPDVDSFGLQRARDRFAAHYLTRIGRLGIPTNELSGTPRELADRRAGSPDMPLPPHRDVTVLARTVIAQYDPQYATAGVEAVGRHATQPESHNVAQGGQRHIEHAA
ncbi:MAG TPA: hypothetical protein VLE99_00790 [Candidatus Saccharimonadales bacterium]|nr:hypothetical protein [Candidatus Saccharimonadales bacterium]